ncbi:MAG: hypothetical protein ACI4JJ_01225 [Huintestinicola sp.]
MKAAFGKKYGVYLGAAAVIWLGFMLIYAGKDVAAAVSESVKSCLNVIIPSLFAFTVVSALLISSDIYKAAAKPFGLISRYIFRLPEEHFPVFLISQLAGYPIGASLVSALREQDKISEREASDMLKFCIAPGPAFIYGAACAIVPDCPKIWLCMFLSVIGANFVILLITAPFHKLPPKSVHKTEIHLSAEDFTAAVSKGSASMLMICSMIIFMAALTACIGKTGIIRHLAVGMGKLFGADPSVCYGEIKSFLEISCVCSLGGGLSSVPAASALLAFGGICVYMQIRAVCGKLIAPRGILLFRFAAAVTAFFISKLIMYRFVTVRVVAVSAEVAGVRPWYGNVAPICSIFLLIMTILLLSQKTMVKSEKI